MGEGGANNVERSTDSPILSVCYTTGIHFLIIISTMTLERMSWSLLNVTTNWVCAMMSITSPRVMKRKGRDGERNRRVWAEQGGSGWGGIE